jgi:predicted Rossmann fold flavoprotein
MSGQTIIIAGGGAAGFFAAIACKESNRSARVVLLEKSPELLAKVTISGGGRCNATHACFDPKILSTRYPRGGRELIGPFHRWQPRDTVEWFESRGVKLKTEPDGRMFPVTDKSSTIVSCLVREAENAGVEIRTQCGVAEATRREGGGFHLVLTDKQQMDCEGLLIATGGNQNSIGHEIASSLGHEITPLVPSLFTFNIKDHRLEGLPGISVPNAEVEAPGTGLRQTGPVLITHWGLSGPAILKLSAWGARAFADRNYEFDLTVNWLSAIKRPALMAKLGETRSANQAKQIGAFSPVEIPSRLWKSLAAGAGVKPETKWASVSNQDIDRIADALHACRFRVSGKSMFKDEFVTCGGVNLREVDFRTMESKLCPGLYFAGEVLDIDGVTGGFNFQAAWTTGWIAGHAMAEAEKSGVRIQKGEIE